LQPADFAGFDHFFEPDYRGMVVENVPDKKRFLFLRGQADQFFAVGLIEGKGLLDKYVLAGVEGLFGDFVVKGGRGGDNDTSYFIIFEDIREFRGDHSFTPTLPSPIKGEGRVGFRHLFAYGLGTIADGFENAKLVEIAYEIFAPVASADDGNRMFNVQGSMFNVVG